MAAAPAWSAAWRKMVETSPEKKRITRRADGGYLGAGALLGEVWPVMVEDNMSSERWP